MRVLTSRVAELEDAKKQLTGTLQETQAAHKVSTHTLINSCRLCTHNFGCWSFLIPNKSQIRSLF